MTQAPNEYDLLKESALGQHAKIAIENEAIRNAFESLNALYLNAWRGTHIEDTSGRERLFQAVNLIDKVRDHLAILISGGKLADVQIREIVAERDAGRKKRTRA